jgi:DNA-binding Xre family transcriptional regulator
MIKYKLDVQEELKKKGYTSYIIRKNKYLSEGTLAKIKRGEPINMKSLNAICCMLRKNIKTVLFKMWIILITCHSIVMDIMPLGMK